MVMGGPRLEPRRSVRGLMVLPVSGDYPWAMHLRSTEMCAWTHRLGPPGERCRIFACEKSLTSEVPAMRGEL